MEPQQNQVELHDRRLEFEHEQLHNYDERQEEMRRLLFVCFPDFWISVCFVSLEFCIFFIAFLGCASAYSLLLFFTSVSAYSSLPCFASASAYSLLLALLLFLHILYSFSSFVVLHILMLPRLTWTFVHCYRLLSRDDSILPLRDIFYDCIQALRRR